MTDPDGAGQSEPDLAVLNYVPARHPRWEPPRGTAAQPAAPAPVEAFVCDWALTEFLDDRAPQPGVAA